MSYYVQLQLTWEEDVAARRPVDLERIVQAAKAVANECGWSEDILDDVRTACASPMLAPPGFKGLQAYGVIHLVREISRRIPEATFHARGCGEVQSDLWIRTFRAGQTTVERGPFDELEAPIPEELLVAAKAAHAAAQPETRLRRWWRRLVGEG